MNNLAAEGEVGKKRPIQLDTRHFEKAGDADSFFREMLHRYNLGGRMTEVDSLDLRALLNLHSEVAEKIGVGISHFEVNTPPEFSGRCFWIIRTDGSRVDFSFKHCIGNKHWPRGVSNA